MYFSKSMQETYQSTLPAETWYQELLIVTTKMCVTIVNAIQNMPLSILDNLHSLPWFYIQISKIKTVFIDSQPEECS